MSHNEEPYILKVCQRAEPAHPISSQVVKKKTFFYPARVIILGTVSKAVGWDVKSGAGCGVRGVITPVSALPARSSNVVGEQQWGAVAFSRWTDAGWTGGGGDQEI